MSDAQNRIAILTHTDDLNTTQSQILEALVETALKHPEILKITQSKVGGILQLNVIYTEGSYPFYDLVGALQNPNGAFWEPRSKEEIATRNRVKGAINRTRIGFRMIVSGDIKTVKQMLERSGDLNEVQYAYGAEIEKIKKLGILLARLKKVELPDELKTTIKDARIHEDQRMAA